MPEYVAIIRKRNGRTARVVEAPDAGTAARNVISAGCSVADLKGGGVEVDIMEIGPTAACYAARYNGEPMTEAHGTTPGVELIVERTDLRGT